LERLKREGVAIDYVVVCSPNYLHDAHCRFGLRIGANVICEKPVVLNARNVDALMIIEQETGKKVFNILQLRLHPEVIRLKERVSSGHYVDLKYVTPRGKWYFQSWKGDENKSGGIVTNIGIHLFDMLLWVFGECEQWHVHSKLKSSTTGVLTMQKCKAFWSLSVEGAAERFLLIDGKPFDFTNGFTELHTASYNEIIAGRGFELPEAKKAIELVNKLRCVELPA
jgi:UDP-N-acetyl-2-amino-2-deoxyglucuronate dehydrogenase